MAKDSFGTQDDKARVENSVRAAAIAAARGVHLSESVLDNIVAETNGPGLSIADRISRASSMAEQYVAAPKPVNYLSATPAELAALGKQEGVKGRFLIDGVTGYVDRDGRNVDSKERRSSAEYDKLASGTVDRATLSALLNEGFTKQQINDAAFTAQALGWKDRQSVKNLAYAGKEFSTLAEQHEQARKDGDTAKMAATMQKMREERDHADGKQKAGMTGIIDKIEKLHAAKTESSLQTKAEQKAPSPQTDADQKAVYEALKKKQVAAVKLGH
jgi:hypothetical protein